MQLSSGQRWVTIHPHGPDEKGQPVLLNGDGAVAGGMGGRFNGKPLAHIYGDTGGDTAKQPAPEGDGPHAQYNPHGEDNELGPEFDATVHGTPAYKDGAFHVHLKNPHLGRALTAGHRTTEGGARLEFHPSGDGVLYHGPAGVHGSDQYADFAHALSMDAGGHVYDHLQREHERRMAGNDQWPDFGDFGGVDEGAPDDSSDEDQQAYQHEALKELSAHRAASLKDVRDFIRGQGGIAPNRIQTAGQERKGVSSRRADEYRYLPQWSKRDSGIPADKMAMHIAEAFPGLGIQTDDDLREYLLEHERERVTREVAGQTYDYSSTQVNLPKQLAERVRTFGRSIPDADLSDDGREEQPHITVKYGLHTSDAADVRPHVDATAPVHACFGRTTVFAASETGGDYDVIIVPVESPDLHRLNAKLADALPHTATHSTYKPHVTVAYVKAGKGARYANHPCMDGQAATFDHLVFSSKDGSQTAIPLGAKPMSERRHVRATDDRAGVREAGWTTKERDDLPDDDFAGPGQSYPIKTQQDVHDAARLIGKADDPAAVKARIKAIARRKGFSLPDAWRDDADDDRPVRETAVQDAQVIETERSTRGVRLKNVQLMSAGPGNTLMGNVYEPTAVQALVREVQRQPKAYLDHSMPSEVRERGHRSLRDLAGVYDRASVRYDAAAQACVADLIVRPSVYDEYIAPVLEAGDNLGISVDGIGHCPDAPRRVTGWKRFNSADLVPAGGARGFIVREADSPATKEVDKEFAMGLLDQVTAGDVQKDAPTLYEAIGRAYAEAHPVVREAQATAPPADDSRLVALETRVREAEERAATSDARVTEMEAERNREVWAQHIAAYVRECGAHTDAVATLIAEPFAGATVGGPDSAYATQEALEAAIKVKAERVLAAVREAATPAPRPASGQITGMGSGVGVTAPRNAYAEPAKAGQAIVDAMGWMMPRVPVPGATTPGP